MQEVGSAGGGITNWHRHDVESMWRLLEHQQTDVYWKRVTGWEKIRDLSGEHLTRLKEYRDNLAAAWPPGKSPAAKAFIDRLDHLINHVQSVHEVAVTNYGTLKTATTAIQASKLQVKEIYDEYVTKRPVRTSAPGTPSPTPSPAPTPPGSEADVERLNTNARSIMAGLGIELTQAQYQIKQPPPYTPPRGHLQETAHDAYGGSSAPPMIPPMVPIPASASTSQLPIGSPTTHVVPAPTAPGAGPILSGAAPAAVAPAVNPLSPSVITPTPSLSPGIGGGLLPAIPGIAPGISSPLGPNPGVPAKRGAGGHAGAAPRAMPPGGMIGGTPGTGLGQPGAGGTPARRINPIGGMISGGTGPGRAPTGDAGQPIGTAPGGHRNLDKTCQRWDPDNPWETDEGVPPVMLPPREPGRVDPGPAIGLNQ